MANSEVWAAASKEVPERRNPSPEKSTARWRRRGLLLAAVASRQLGLGFCGDADVEGQPFIGADVEGGPGADVEQNLRHGCYVISVAVDLRKEGADEVGPGC